MIIKINNDYFLVDGDRFKKEVSKFKEDWIKVTEWVEVNGKIISDEGYILLSEEEADAILKELTHTYISKGNEMCKKVISRLWSFREESIKDKTHARKN